MRAQRRGRAGAGGGVSQVFTPFLRKAQTSAAFVYSLCAPIRIKFVLLFHSPLPPSHLVARRRAGGRVPRRRTTGTIKISHLSLLYFRVVRLQLGLKRDKDRRQGTGKGKVRKKGCLASSTRIRVPFVVERRPCRRSGVTIFNLSSPFTLTPSRPRSLIAFPPSFLERRGRRSR